jgi:hypothetical protein
MVKKCDNCGREYTKPPHCSSRSWRKRRYCSKKCWYQSKERETTFSKINRGRRNPAFKGGKASIVAIHKWVSRRLPKSDVCEHCGHKGYTEMSNKSGNYLRDLSDWQWLCRKCHFKYDNKGNVFTMRGKKMSNKSRVKISQSITKWWQKRKNPIDYLRKFIENPDLLPANKEGK